MEDVPMSVLARVDIDAFGGSVCNQIDSNDAVGALEGQAVQESTGT